MEDNHLDSLLRAHFSKKVSLEDNLVSKTKKRLQEKAEKKNNLMLCFIQLGFLLMSFALGSLVIITFGISLVFIISIVGYVAAISLIATLFALIGSEKIRIIRSIRVYE